MGPILSLHQVVAGYGAGDILRGVDLDVEAAQVTCLIGPNGAGKSTVLKSVSGLVHPRAGSVLFEGVDIVPLSPRARLRMGIVHVPQDRSLFPEMTIWENLLMGGYSLADRRLARRRAEGAADVFPICRERATERAGSLSGGEQKLVELARTLMLEPKLILLDEPSIGLEPRARETVFSSIRQLAEDGHTVVLVEQNAKSGLAVADRGVVLEAGRVRLIDTGAALLDNPDVGRLYLGAMRGEAAASTLKQAGDVGESR